MTPDEMLEAVKNDPRSMKERMLDGELYIADDPQLAADHERARKLMFQIVNTYPESFEGAQNLIAELFGSKGKDSVVLPPLSVDYGYNVHIGDDTFINTNLTALDVGEIRIGNHVQIGPNVQLLTPTHRLANCVGQVGRRSPIVVGITSGWVASHCASWRHNRRKLRHRCRCCTRIYSEDSVAVNPARVIKSVHDF